MKCNRCGTEYETPYCVSVICLTKEIIRIEKNPQGGFLTYFYGSKYPVPFFPKSEDLGYVDTLKRVLIASLRLVVSFPVTPKRLVKGIKVWMGDIYQAGKGQNPHRLSEEDFSPTSKEVLRALKATEPDNKEWCYYLVAIWNTDQAYGLRGKDVFQLLNKKNLKKNPRKEMLRLVDILIERDSTKWGWNQIKKDKIIRNLLSVVLLFKGFRQPIQDFFTELDIEKMQFDLNERYWLANKFDYNYEGKTYEERMVWKNKEDETYQEPERPKEIPRIQIQQPNKEFYNLNRKDAEEMAERTKRTIIENYVAYQGK